VTALQLQGIWIPRSTGLHVACAPHSARLRSPRDSRVRVSPSDRVRVHWRDLPDGGSRLILDPLDALRDALACVDADAILPTADSVLYQHPELKTNWTTFCESAPAHRRQVLLTADGICESGIETMTWMRLRHLPMTRQVAIRGVGDIDFLVGDRLVIEVDGEQYHTDPQQFENDRRRDAVLASLGYVVLRFSYRQVTERWHEVQTAVDAMLNGGFHPA